MPWCCDADSMIQVFGTRYSDACLTRRAVRAKRVYTADDTDFGAPSGSMPF
jgi:hypothetical protein